MTDTTGARVRSVRARTGMSQLELARAAGLSDAYVSLIEAGKRTASLKALTAVGKVLGTTAEYLQNGEDSPVELAVREAIYRAREQVSDGHPECAETTLAGIDTDQVSHLNRLGYLRASGLVHDALGELEAAVTLLGEALDEARMWGTPQEIAELGMWLVGALQDSGALDAAVAAGEVVLAEVEKLGFDGTDEHLRLASTLLWAIFQRGDRAHAKARAREYIEIAEAVATPRGRGSILWNAALITQEGGGDDDEAVRLAQVALDGMLESGSARDVPRLRYDYATILLKCSPPRPEPALEQLEIAEEQLRRFGSKVEVARCVLEKGRARLYLGQLDAADELINRGLTDLTATGTLNLDTCEGFTLLGDLASLRDDLPLAVKLYGWAAERLALMSATRYAGQTWTELARRLAAVGRPAEAVAAFQRALSTLRLESLAPWPFPAAEAPPWDQPARSVAAA